MQIILSVFFAVVAISVAAQDLTVTNANAGRSNKSKGGELYKPGFQMGIQAGQAIPAGSFKDDDLFTDPGLSLSGNVEYQWPMLGVGIVGGFFNNPVEDKVHERLDRLELPYDVFFSSNRWASGYAGLGPSIQFGKNKFNAQIMSRVGSLWLTSPEFQANHPVGGQSIGLIDYPEEKFSFGFLSFGTKFRYNFSEHLGAHVKLNYLSALSKKEYTYSYLDLSIHGDPPYSEVEIAESPVVEQVVEVNPQVFQFEAGIAYRFGGKRVRQEPEKVEEISSSCFPVELTGPVDQINIYIFGKRAARTGRDPRLESGIVYPNYTWHENPSSDSDLITHIFRLYDESDNVIYEERTKESRIEHSKKLQDTYQSVIVSLPEEREGKILHWHVESLFENCERQVSKRRRVGIMKNPSGLDANFRNIMCDSPAFDTLGFVHYTGEVELYNSPNNTMDLVIVNSTPNLIHTIDGSNQTQIEVTNINQAFPITLAPGTSVVVSFSFKRPFGETETFLRVPYHPVGYPALDEWEPSRADLPNCVCDVCDEWKITSTGSSSSSTEPGYNVAVSSIFLINNADPIQEVKAEVVYVEHKVNDILCYSCTKQANEMALFNWGDSPSWGTPSDAWQNNGAATLTDNNNDGYSNQLTWHAAPSNGVKFSLGTALRVGLNLPHFSSLECCADTYKMCIRYTFTDINCKTCDYLVCYVYQHGKFTTQKPNGKSFPSRPKKTKDQSIKIKSGDLQN